MRFTAANFVLGLATLGNLRPTFGRVLYGYDTGEHRKYYYNSLVTRVI